MKVMTVVGTRPEIIRLAAVMKRLDATEGIEHVLVHTGRTGTDSSTRSSRTSACGRPTTCWTWT